MRLRVASESAERSSKIASVPRTVSIRKSGLKVTRMDASVSTAEICPLSHLDCPVLRAGYHVRFRFHILPRRIRRSRLFPEDSHAAGHGPARAERHRAGRSAHRRSDWNCERSLDMFVDIRPPGPRVQRPASPEISVCRWLRVGAAALCIFVAAAPRAHALDRLCDPGAEDCRAILLNYINAEHVGI